MARFLIQILVEEASVREAVTVACSALVGVGGGGASPGRVVVEGQALVAVGARRVVLAAAHAHRRASQVRHRDALARVPVALAPGADGEIGDGVEVGSQHLRVAEHLVTERVEAVQRDPQLRGRHPVLQLWRGVELVGGGPALERGEGDVSAGQRRDVRVLGRAQRARLVAAPRVVVVRQAVRVAARRAVELVRHPGAALSSPLVDGEALGARRIEPESDVRDVERLP